MFFSVGVSMPQSLCGWKYLETFVPSRSLFANIDIIVIMATQLSIVLNVAKLFHGQNEIATIKPVVDHF